MIGFGSLPEDGPARVERALRIFEEDSPLLNRARRQYIDASPPPYTLKSSDTMTRSTSPEISDEEKRWQLIEERRASYPRTQFSAQINDEEKRLYEMYANGTSRPRLGESLHQLAHDTVKSLWVEQGIWNNKWNSVAAGRWKHEEPLKDDLELERILTTHAPLRASLFSHHFEPETTRPDSDNEKRHIIEQRVKREREREASRPYHQFVFQISKERERIENESTNGEVASVSAADINTRAYENIKSTWIRRRIWNERWGIMPGMLWKHEDPLEENIPDCPQRLAIDLPGNINHAATGNLPGRVLGSIHADDSSCHQSLNVTSPLRERFVDIHTINLQSDESESSPCPSNLPRLISLEQSIRATASQVSKPIITGPPDICCHPQPTRSTVLGPIHGSRISKAVKKTSPRLRQRSSVSRGAPSGDTTISDVHDPKSENVESAEKNGHRSQRKHIKLPKYLTKRVNSSLSARLGTSGPKHRSSDSAKLTETSKRQPLPPKRDKSRRLSA